MSEQTDEMRTEQLPELDDAAVPEVPDDVSGAAVTAEDGDDAPGPEGPEDAAGEEGGDEGPGDEGLDGEASGPPASSRIDQLEAEGDIAADYLEELLDIADLDGDLDIDVDGDRAAVSIIGADLSQLVGSDGEVLEALQELTRLAVYRETGDRSRLMLDISGYRAEKRSQLERLAEETVARVRESGEPAPLEPMSPFERKVVHDAVAAAGLTSESEGVEPRRFVVVLPV